MKLGIVGSGMIVKDFLKMFNELNGIELLGISARNEENLKNLCVQYPIERYYLSYEEMLENKEIDIVFSKEVDNYKTKNIKYLHLGFLNDIFIANKNSCFEHKIFDKTCLQNSTIYVPRKYAQTVMRLVKETNGIKLDLKNSSYNTILEVVSKSEAVGFVTKEYIDNKDLEKYNLIELKNNLNLEPVSFGIYYCMDKYNKVSNLIKIIKGQFNNKQQ